ncbi:MAG: hypothetical protein CR217_05870 [Beijerinckiaceae bacterium]|nr:MAG: hypothetical protein CR217_05870 [Beijerinckiaceae bacterium]
MTRTKKTPPPARAKAVRRARSRLPGHWLLQDAKARFSELVRRVRSDLKYIVQRCVTRRGLQSPCFAAPARGLFVRSNAEVAI